MLLCAIFLKLICFHITPYACIYIENQPCVIYWIMIPLKHIVTYIQYRNIHAMDVSEPYVIAGVVHTEQNISYYVVKLTMIRGQSDMPTYQGREECSFRITCHQSMHVCTCHSHTEQATKHLFNIIITSAMTMLQITQSLMSSDLPW